MGKKLFTAEYIFDDEAGVFASDEDAIAHVRERAATGSDLHVRALKLHEGE